MKIKFMIKKLIGKLKRLRLYIVIGSGHKVKVDEETGEIKLPKRKLKMPTEYWL